MNVYERNERPDLHVTANQKQTIHDVKSCHHFVELNLCIPYSRLPHSIRMFIHHHHSQRPNRIVSEERRRCDANVLIADALHPPQPIIHRTPLYSSSFYPFVQYH